MEYRDSPYNRRRRLGAGLVLMGFGGMLLAPLPPLGLPLIALGFSVVVFQGWNLWRERGDPYDLARLQQVHNALTEPEDDGREPELAYCHHCGASVSAAHSLCPQCGRVLGSS